MSRPKKCRWITIEPDITVFKPRGVPAKKMEVVELQLDELEAIRLADLEGLYQSDAAERMELSRATFGRIINEARRKVADALINGKMLVFKGGNIALSKIKELQCTKCGKQIDIACSPEKPDLCPSCSSRKITCCGIIEDKTQS